MPKLKLSLSNPGKDGNFLSSSEDGSPLWKPRKKKQQQQKKTNTDEIGILPFRWNAFKKQTSDNGSNTSLVIFTSQETVCSHSSKTAPAALKCHYGALTNTKAKMTTAFASTGLNSATIETDSVV